MRSSWMLLLALVVGISVLFAASEGWAQAPVCFTWTRTIGTTATPQTYLLNLTPFAPIGGVFFKFVGRHDGACGTGTSRTMEGVAWVRSSRLELSFNTPGELSFNQLGTATGEACGAIQARAVVDLDTLNGTIKYQEAINNNVGGTSPNVLVEVDTVGGLASAIPAGLPFSFSSNCPSGVPSS